jgi:serine/threonine protein phosphatase PrpC
MTVNRSNPHPTAAESRAAGTGTTDAEFQPLPEGALVAGDTLYVAQVCVEGADHNTYVVEEITATLPCPNPICGCTDNPVGQPACVACGTSLEGVMALRQRYRLHEYRDAAAVETAAFLTANELRHTALLPHAYFSERPYGTAERYYLLVPDPLPVTASHLPLPQKLVRVLSWGIQLGEGLAFLHDRGIGWVTVDADHIVVQDRSAMWCELGDTYRLPEAAAEAAPARAANVVDLARVLYRLATGRDEFDPDAGLPAPLADVFERFLAAERSDLTADQLVSALQGVLDTLRRPTTLRMRLGHCTDVGLVRDLNEDSLLALEVVRVRRSVHQSISVLAVADGMGGHAAGDVASGLAVDTLAAHVVTHLLTPHLTANGDDSVAPLAGWLESAVQAANQAVFDRRMSAQNNMGTTLVAAVVADDQAYVANIGDSRAYLINGTEIRRVTTDHSLVERLVALGHIDADEARVHPQRNVIYRTLGDKPEAEADYFALQLQPGDRLLLCSDGLTAEVEDRAIQDAVMRSSSPQQACEQLVSLANAHGGHDNITVVVLQVE